MKSGKTLPAGAFLFILCEEMGWRNPFAQNAAGCMIRNLSYIKQSSNKLPDHTTRKLY